MPKLSLCAVALTVLLAACSAAAQNGASVQPMTAAPAVGEPAPSVSSELMATEAPRVAPAPQAFASRQVTCEVRSRATANGMVIQARAFADRDVDGEYELRITKSGGGNSAEINQGGPLLIAAGSSAILGENEISIERGARVRALLTLRDERGELCRRSFRL